VGGGIGRVVGIPPLVVNIEGVKGYTPGGGGRKVNVFVVGSGICV